MASPRKSKAVKAPEFAYSLESVIEATIEGSFVYTAPEFHKPLVESGDVEVNAELVNENGELATRATAKHIPQQTEESSEMTETTEASTPETATKPLFAIKSGEVPAVTRKTGGARAGRTAIYPFADLEIKGNNYFFVPNVGDKSAFKSLASTVSGANARYSEIVEGEFRTNRKGKTVSVTRQLRKFKAFDSSEVIDGVEVFGAKVFRIPLEAEAAE